MYITDKETKQCICSYIRHRYGAGIELNRIYVFRYDYDWNRGKDEYLIHKYKGSDIQSFPESIPVKEVDMWGIILSRKEKINKIRENGSV